MGKISSYTELEAEPADDDYLVVHTEDTATNKITYANFRAWTDTTFYPIEVDSFNFDASQIATIYSSPITLFSGIPSNKRIIILNAVLYYNYGTAAYTTRAVYIRYASGQCTNQTYFENAGDDSVINLAPVETTSSITNGDILFTCLTNDPGGVGDGVMELQVTYQYIDV